MSAENLVSVVIVTHDTGSVLVDAIGSVLNQDADVELILVNNGNPPDVEESLIARFKDDPQVRLMTGHGDIGMAKALNLGARVAAGRRLLFLSPFAVLPTNAVSSLLAQEERLKRPFLLGARLVNPEGEELPISRRAILTPKSAVIEALHLYNYYKGIRLNFHKEPVPKTIVSIPAISHSFMYIFKDDFVAMQGFKETYRYFWEDMDFCARFKRRGGAAYFTPNLVVSLVPEREKPSFEKEKARASEMIHYFQDNFADSYFQPFLWLLYGGLWARFLLRFFGPGWVLRAREYAEQAQAKAKEGQKHIEKLKNMRIK